MTTQTKSLDQWLEECPYKLEFYSRFIDVKEDIELVIENEKLEVDDDTKEIVLKPNMNQDWSENNEFISYLINEVKEGNLWLITIKRLKKYCEWEVNCIILEIIVPTEIEVEIKDGEIVEVEKKDYYQVQSKMGKFYTVPKHIIKFIPWQIDYFFVNY